VLAPDVNESNYKFTPLDEQRIRFGLGAVRNVGQGAIESILASRREKGPFTSLFDLCERVDLRLCNKRVFEALIAAGALDSLGGHRAQFYGALDAAISEAQLKQDEAATGQGFLFGGGPTDDKKGAHGQPTLPNVAPLTDSERLQKEKEILGFYISGHPLEPFRTECELFATHTVSQLGVWTPSAMALGCVVTAIKRQMSKRSGAEFARLTIEDFTGSAEVLVFPEAWSVIAERVRADVPILLKGNYSKRDEGADTPTFIVESLQRFAELRTNGNVAVQLELAPNQGMGSDVMRDVRHVAEAHPGTAPLELRWSDGRGNAARLRSRSLTIAAANAPLKELRALLGDERVKLVRGS
jgi:DNA polymerase-3 subunit alpha